MLELIDKEEKADEDQHTWCVDERKTNTENLKKKKTEITGLEDAITDLTNTIEAPDTGLKFQIADTEAALATNSGNQREQTEDRTEDNLAYQKNVANLVE